MAEKHAHIVKHLKIAKWVFERKKAFSQKDMCIDLEMQPNTASLMVQLMLDIGMIKEVPHTGRGKLYEPI